MKALFLTEVGKSEVREIEKPVPKPNEVLLKVEMVGFCGGDMNGFKGLFPFRNIPTSSDMKWVRLSKNWAEMYRSSFESAPKSPSTPISLAAPAWLVAKAGPIPAKPTKPWECVVPAQ